MGRRAGVKDIDYETLTRAVCALMGWRCETGEAMEGVDCTFSVLVYAEWVPGESDGPVIYHSWHSAWRYVQGALKRHKEKVT